MIAFDLSEEQRRRYLAMLASADGSLGAIAFTEPHAGSDVQAMRASARREGDEYILSGEKCYITNGGIADLTVVFAKVEGAISAFLVKRDDPGVVAGRNRCGWAQGGQAGSPRLPHRLAFPRRGPHSRRAPARRGGAGFQIALDFFQASRPQVAASAVGVARAAFEYATEYARTREAFGQPLMSKQAVSFKLAEMAMEIEAARLLVWRACAALDAGEDAGLLGSYAKAFAADTAMRVTTEAVQVLGGAGIMRDHPVEEWMRDAKALQIVEGTSEIQRLIVATYLAQAASHRHR